MGFDGYTAAVFLSDVVIYLGIRVKTKDTMLGNEFRGASVEVDVGGKVDAATVAVGAIVAYHAFGDGGWAFQQ